MKVKVDGIVINVPESSSSFLHEAPHAKYVECNYDRAQDFHKQFGKDTTAEAVTFKRKARNVLQKVKVVFDELGIPFWLLSGTFLGELKRLLSLVDVVVVVVVVVVL